MEDNELYAERFGQAIVVARDSTISNFDFYFSGKSKAKYGKFIHSLYAKIEQDPKSSLALLLPCIVDEAIGIVLQVFDEMQDSFEVKLKKNGLETSIYDEYELLEPELRPKDGWIHKYSKERIIEME